MKRFAVVLAFVGCGDNSQQCGPGTIDVAGVCTPAASCGTGTMATSAGTCAVAPTVCAQGTQFDMTIDQCTLDPAVCQGGTVLVANQCVDPTSQLAIDLEEGPEPNGLGLLGEVSTTPAGVIALPVIGAPAFVAHGHITPAQDTDGDGQLDPDIDAYQVAVDAPTVVRVTVAGIGGLAGGFLAAAQVTATDPLASWQRIGAELTGATSRRDLYLPEAGTYLVGIADTRTLFLPGAAAGGPNAEYFASFEQLDVPTPTPLVLAGSSAAATGTIAETPSLYSFELTPGTAAVTLAMPQVQTVASVVVVGTTITVANEPASGPAHASVVNATDAPVSLLVVVDDVSAYGLAPSPFTLSIHVTP